MAILRAGDSRALAREWRVQLRLRQRFERRLNRQMAAIIRDAGRKAADAYAAVGIVGVDIALREHRAEVSAALVAHYRRVMSTFGRRLIQSAPRGTGVPETKDTLDSFDARVQSWITTNGALKVTQISTTTRNQIVDIIRRGEADGLGVDPIARNIAKNTDGVIGRFRASIIARTETHSAASAAQNQALEVLDLPQVRKEWVAVKDQRTRDSHIAADGQIRRVNEPFDVGGSKLMFPGDPTGPADEVINCRCIAAPVVED